MVSAFRSTCDHAPTRDRKELDIRFDLATRRTEHKIGLLQRRDEQRQGRPHAAPAQRQDQRQDHQRQPGFSHGIGPALKKRQGEEPE